VVTSAGIARRYGLILTNLLQRVGPERFFEQLASGLNGQNLGTVLYHLYPFGGIAYGVHWMNRYLLRRNLPAIPRSSRG
jgi:methylenetetrahydrofolate reductase (NADPH)